MQFEWDLEKEIMNIKKHRVYFSEAVETFSDSKGFQMVDYKHSTKENRFYWIGKSMNGHVLTTWFTRRENIIRIIGSAKWRKFKKLYETTQIN